MAIRVALEKSMAGLPHHPNGVPIVARLEALWEDTMYAPAKNAGYQLRMKAQPGVQFCALRKLPSTNRGFGKGSVLRPLS